MIKLETKNCNMISTEKQQKISALSSGKIDKYEYITGKELLPSNQRQVIGQAKFACSPLGKAFENKQKGLKVKEKNK